MSDPTIVARHFIQSIAAGEFAAARSYLDDHVAFEGPFDSFDNAEAYLAALRRLHPSVAGVEIRKVFADGDDVCVLYDLKRFRLRMDGLPARQDRQSPRRLRRPPVRRNVRAVVSRAHAGGQLALSRAGAWAVATASGSRRIR